MVSDDDVIKLTKKHTPVIIPVAQNPQPKLKIFFFYSTLYDATSHYSV